MKWGTAYGPEYVNRLYAGVRRHLSLPFRFVCLTDDARDLHPLVQALPLPEVVVKARNGDLRWRKLGVLQENLFGLTGPALFLDLDTVVVGDLAPLFELPGRFCIGLERALFPIPPVKSLRRWLFKRRVYRNAHVEGNSSVFRFELGTLSDVLDRYLADPAAASRRYRREQEFLTLEVMADGEVTYWPEGWCVSYLCNCVEPWPARLWRPPVVPPEAKVVIFINGCAQKDLLEGTVKPALRRGRTSEVGWLRAAWSDP
jgi:hypothetical protein